MWLKSVLGRHKGSPSHNELPAHIQIVTHIDIFFFQHKPLVQVVWVEGYLYSVSHKVPWLLWPAMVQFVLLYSHNHNKGLVNASRATTLSQLTAVCCTRFHTITLRVEAGWLKCSPRTPPPCPITAGFHVYDFNDWINWNYPSGQETGTMWENCWNCNS